MMARVEGGWSGETFDDVPAGADGSQGLDPEHRRRRRHGLSSLLRAAAASLFHRIGVGQAQARLDSRLELEVFWTGSKSPRLDV